MALAKSNRDRVHQIGRWLAAEFPTIHPVTVKTPLKIPALPGSDPAACRTGDWGETYRLGRQIVIRIAVRPGFPRASIIDTLLHEWAHAASMRHQKMEDRRTVTAEGHDEEWALMYGKIYRAYIDDGGWEVSGDY